MCGFCLCSAGALFYTDGQYTGRCYALDFIDTDHMKHSNQQFLNLKGGIE